MRGGGTTGPVGVAESARAGEPGAYHHSRNLTKNIAVGRSNRRESSSSLGEVRISRRILAKMPFRCSGVNFAR